MRNSQAEYNTILDGVKARAHALSQAECERILMDHAYSYGQAKNGAYVYLHHGESLVSRRWGSAKEYAKILDTFGAPKRKPKECISHLELMGFTYRQAQTAVYKYRCNRRLVRRGQ